MHNEKHKQLREEKKEEQTSKRTEDLVVTNMQMVMLYKARKIIEQNVVLQSLENFLYEKIREREGKGKC